MRWSNGWDTAGTSHTILYTSFAMNSANDNVCGRMTIYAFKKDGSGSTSSSAVYVGDYFKTFNDVYTGITQATLTKT
eukprot:17276-Eustigmatos_ZCMA.PRE.1